MLNTMTLGRIRAVPVLIAAGTGQWLAWHAGSGAAQRVVQTVRDPARRADPGLTGDLVVDAACTLVLVAGTWLVAATVLTVVAQTAPVSVGRRCPALAPGGWRRLVIGLLGTGVLALPVAVAGTANAGGDRGPGPGDNSLGELHGLPYPDRPSGPERAAPDPPPAPRSTVVVRPGDSLWSLAAALDPGATDAELAKRWPRWYAANREVIGPDPDLLTPGTVLDRPEHP